jgi:hypothetical protein
VAWDLFCNSGGTQVVVREARCQSRWIILELARSFVARMYSSAFEYVFRIREIRRLFQAVFVDNFQVLGSI